MAYSSESCFWGKLMAVWVPRHARPIYRRTNHRTGFPTWYSNRDGSRRERHHSHSTKIIGLCILKTEMCRELHLLSVATILLKDVTGKFCRVGNSFDNFVKKIVVSSLNVIIFLNFLIIRDNWNEYHLPPLVLLAIVTIWSLPNSSLVSTIIIILKEPIHSDCQ